jgi:hypothetical protein
MKTSQIFTAGLFLASAATSKNQVEARLPIDKGVAAVRGASTGAIAAVVKNIASGLSEAAKGGASTENKKPKDVAASQDKTQDDPLRSAKNAIKNFPVGFGANTVATAFVDKAFGTPKNTPKNIQELLLPMLSMGVTKELLKDAGIPQTAKEALAYGAFWGMKVVQGKGPLTSGLAVSGYAAGAKLVTSLGNDSNESKSTAAALSGSMAPESSKELDKAGAGSCDDYIRGRYGMKEREKFWTGPDGSIFCPISDKEYEQHLSHATAKPRDSQQNTSNRSKAASGVSASAVSGFMAPESSKIPDKAPAGSYDDHIRERYGMKEGEKFWTGPDGSVFVPISDEEDEQNLSR